jgi:hypothetical protein
MYSSHTPWPETWFIELSYCTLLYIHRAAMLTKSKYQYTSRESTEKASTLDFAPPNSGRNNMSLPRAQSFIGTGHTAYSDREVWTSDPWSVILLRSRSTPGCDLWHHTTWRHWTVEKSLPVPPEYFVHLLCFLSCFNVKSVSVKL